VTSSKMVLAAAKKKNYELFKAPSCYENIPPRRN
jgi:hypothetical protein